MPESHRDEQNRRRVTNVERFFTRSPYSIVTLLARIRGSVSESALRHAVLQVQRRHYNLRARIVEDDDGDPWFTSEGAREIEIEAVPRESDEHWIATVEQAVRVPFDFHDRPPIRFILLQSPGISDLVILCHHIICDGLSLAYLARDLMQHLGDARREVEVLPDPIPVNEDTMPADVSLNRLARLLIGRVNRRWEDQRTVFDQEDYQNLAKAYWSHYRHRVLSVEVSEAQTAAIVDRCRQERLTVNSALSTAIAGAEHVVRRGRSGRASLRIGVSLRDRLQRSVGEVMGFYAGIVSLKYQYSRDASFWENARRFQRQFGPMLNNKNLLRDFLNWCALDPTIIEAVNFKKLGGLVPEHSTRYRKLSAFAKQEDVVLSILKRDRMESLESTMGTAITNLTRLDFPTKYGSLELDRLIMKPGGGFPLANFNLVLGAVTCAGRLSLVVEFVEQSVDAPTMGEIKDRALEFLLAER